MSDKLTRYISGVTILTEDVSNSWYGGLFGTEEGNELDAQDPLVAGHVHDGQHLDGHAQKINLSDHVTGQLDGQNIQDGTIPNSKLISPGGGGGAFITISNVTSNLPGTPSTDDFVFGSDSLDDDGDSTHDSRFLFDKSKSAFRAGSANSTQWDDANRGTLSFCFGFNSTASAPGSIALGSSHTVSGVNSAILSGLSSSVTSLRSVIAGGDTNSIAASDSFIGGGGNSGINSGAINSVIGGGTTNTIYGAINTIAGGSGNVAGISGSPLSSVYNFIGGGNTNVVQGNLSSVVGGDGNQAGQSTSDSYIFIGGGLSNTVDSSYSSIIGGETNVIDDSSGDSRWSLIGGGTDNLINDSEYTTILGGENNRITSSDHAAILSGGDTLLVNTNEITNCEYGVIVGGRNNVINIASGSYNSILNGESNNIGSGSETINYSSILSGAAHNITGTHSAISDGLGNVADGNGTLVGGSGARSTIWNQFVRGAGIPATAVGSAPAQSSVYSFAAKTTNATTDTLQAGPTASTDNFVIRESSAYTFRMLITARQEGGAAGTVGDSKGWEVTGMIKRGAGGIGASTTAFVGTPSVTVIAEDAAASAWTVAVNVDDATETLDIDVTGEASKNIIWHAVVTTSESSSEA